MRQYSGVTATLCGMRINRVSIVGTSVGLSAGNEWRRGWASAPAPCEVVNRSRWSVVTACTVGLSRRTHLSAVTHALSPPTHTPPPSLCQFSITNSSSSSSFRDRAAKRSAVILPHSDTLYTHTHTHTHVHFTQSADVPSLPACRTLY